MRAKIQGKTAIIKYYQDKEVASKYMTQRYSSLFGKLNNESECRAINSLLKEIKPARVLDIAVGTGRIAKCLQHYKHGFAIDTSREMLKLAKPALKGWTLKQANAFNLPFKDNYFDAIISTRFIWHFNKKDRYALLSAIYFKLKTHGYLIFEVPNINVKRAMLIKAKIGKKRIYTQLMKLDAIEKEIKANGFEMVATKAISRNAEMLQKISETTNSVFGYCLMNLISLLSRKEPYTYIVLARKI